MDPPSGPDLPPGLAERVVAWQRAHGRHDLPWQQPPEPWRVWISEIMLQQTRVETVLPYFRRFVAAFPHPAALAAASVDEVLGHWAGLGYYARARNLHRAARRIVEQHAGRIPETLEGLMALPGIGRSTAGAILALAHGRPCAILDGNVRRVLARLRAVPGWPGSPSVQRRLWALSEALVPQSDVRAYTQGLMDLGAMVCTRARPACGRCPLSDDCRAFTAGRVDEFPAPRPRRERPLKELNMVFLERSDGAVLLQRRPPAGVWGGLWTLPEWDGAEPVGTWAGGLGVCCGETEEVTRLAHGLTHFQLEIRVLRAPCRPAGAMEGPDVIWYKPGDPRLPAVPAPVRRLLEALAADRSRVP